MSLKALVVDDDEFVRTVLSQQLRLLGSGEVRTARDGTDAERVLAADGPFDLIVLDLQMPGTDGIELLRKLASAHATADVILTSSVDEKLLVTAAALARAHGLRLLGTVPKPVGVPALRALLDRRTAARAAAPAASASVSADELGAALVSGAIQPYFQPKVRARDGALLSVEALARWVRPDGVTVPPARFIPLAEACRRIDDLTRSMLTQSAVALSKWRAEGLSVTLEVNLSAASLVHVALPDEASAIVEAAGIAPRQVIFEITESVLIADLARSLDTLTRLRLRGFNLAVDDFGTGHSTFTQLKQLPVSELKIDQSFVGSAVRDPEARAIVESSRDLAHQFRLTSVAEGVEDAPTAALMRELGVDLLQGYFYARPMPANALGDWWRRR